ncbi:hypothetical protein L1785_19830 [Antribacter sp. KLBMP9083]|uniref:Uncharacterized protein n=1 Tax=Antribacter soli TaxID=2910976 RepID=A0AA41UDL9_9MICO|nr:hypothetical protein [Antribacter soli]MCF4123224.1 hypothetical protein [Antribacter soli]
MHVTDATHGETIAHLLGLRPRTDAEHFAGRSRSYWSGWSGRVPVLVTAPLALGGLPARRPWAWTAGDVRAVA